MSAIQHSLAFSYVEPKKPHVIAHELSGGEKQEEKKLNPLQRAVAEFNRRHRKDPEDYGPKRRTGRRGRRHRRRAEQAIVEIRSEKHPPRRDETTEKISAIRRAHLRKLRAQKRSGEITHQQFLNQVAEIDRQMRLDLQTYHIEFMRKIQKEREKIKNLNEIHAAQAHIQKFDRWDK